MGPEVKPSLHCVPPITDLYKLPRTLVPRTLVPRTLVPRTLVPRTLVPRTLVPRTLVPRTLVPRTLVPRTLVPRTALALTRAGFSFVESTLYASGLVAIAFLVAIRLLISDFFSMDMAFFPREEIFLFRLTSLYLAQRLPNRMNKTKSSTASKISKLQPRYALARIRRR
jgi:hypothetical protein